jgi:putative transposase
MQVGLSPVHHSWLPAGNTAVVQNGHKPPRASGEPLMELDQKKLYSLRADQLRLAVRGNLVSFPSQVPVFERHDRPDLQRKVVQLYFVLGWSCGSIAKRYGVNRQRVGQILRTWQRRAVEMGYVQHIPPPESNQLPGKEIRVVFSPVVRDPRAPVPAETQDLEATDEAKSYRPRRKADLTQIRRVLELLAKGRSASQAAEEVGVSRETVYAWKRKYGHSAHDAAEMYFLRSENAQLRKLLAYLGGDKESLMDFIRKSYGVCA